MCLNRDELRQFRYERRKKRDEVFRENGLCGAIKKQPHIYVIAFDQLIS
jgi:hypothetical protein